MQSPKVNWRFIEDKADHDLIYLPPDSHELKSSIVPAMVHLIKSLSSSMDPTNLQQDPSKKLELVLEILHQLHQTIKRFFLCLVPLDAFEVSLENPSHFHELSRSDLPTKAFSMFRYQKLIGWSKCLADDMQEFLEASSDFFKTLDLKDITNVQQNASPNQELPNPRSRWSRAMKFSRSSSLLMLKFIDQHLARSDHSIIQEEWRQNVRSLNHDLGEITHLIKPRPSEEEPKPYRPPRGEVEGLKWMATLLKLTRMFLIRLSKNLKNQGFSRMISDMSLEHLFSSRAHVEPIHMNFSHLMGAFDERFIPNDEYEPRDGYLYLEDALKRFSECFQPCVPILIDFFNSLPTAHPHHDDHKIQLHKNWFLVWHSQFNLVVDEVKDAFEWIPYL